MTTFRPFASFEDNRLPARSIKILISPSSLWSLVSLLSLTHPLHASATGENVNDRIRRVESGLLPGVVLKGEAGIGADIRERMKFHKVPGVSIAVINNGKLEWARAYGIIEAGSSAPVTTMTLFQAGSISKPVAAAGALRLVDRGILSLDEDVNAKLRSWKVPESDFTKNEKVTLRRILSHTAGLTVHGFPGYSSTEPVPTLIQVLNGEKPANTAATRVDILPGSAVRYSGGGTTVMQQLVIDASGRSFPAYIRDSVLRPLGMRESTYEQPLPESRRARAAAAHSSTGEPVNGRFHTYPEMAAAGLWTTPSDLARFTIEIMRSADGRSRRLLNPETARLMTTSHKDGAALGFFIGGEGDSTTFSHGGRDRGFDAKLEAYPRLGRAARVMINANNDTGFIPEVMRAIAREYGWPGYPSSQREYIRLTAAALEKCPGVYRWTPSRTLTISLRDGRLFGKPSDAPELELFAESDTKFFLAHSPITLEFVPGAGSAAEELILRNGPNTTRLKREGS